MPFDIGDSVTLFEPREIPGHPGVFRDIEHTGRVVSRALRNGNVHYTVQGTDGSVFSFDEVPV